MARLPSTAGDPQVTDVNLKTDLEKVADHIVEIDTVAQALDDDIIQTCNSFEPEIRSVAINIGDVQLVAQVSGGVTTLATNIDGINTVAANLGAILNCSTNMAILQLLDLRMADLEAITTSLPNIDLVATHMDSVIAVENGIPYVVNCVEHMEDIIKVSDNMNNTLKYLGAYSQDPTERPDGTPLQDGDYYLNTILNALVYYNLGSNSWFEVDPQEVLSARDEAVTAAEEAVLSADRSEAAAVGLELAETNAAQSASEALASKNAAGLSEGKAKTSETNAKTSETNAEASAQRAEEAFDSFDDVYLGAFVTAPQTDNDGDPLEVGMTYWSTPEETLFYFTGSVWESPDAAAQDSANKAATSASEASASESAALVSANNASNSETASSASESAAGVSATQASTSASNAASSASGANQSKLDAQSAAVQAANSEARASSSESNAASSAVSALDSKEKARVSEVNALASESKASTSETNAATSETNASTSAANALAEADRAADAAEQAATSAASLNDIRYSKLDNPLTHLFKKNKLVDTLQGELTWTRDSGATYVDQYGVVQYSPSTNATNLLLWSEDFSNTAWLKGGTSISVNTAISPKGSGTDEVIIDEVSSAHTLRRVFPNGLYLVSDNTTLTCSVFVKPMYTLESDIISLYSTSRDGLYRAIILSIKENTFYMSGATAKGNLSDEGNGWLRLSLTFDVGTGTGTEEFGINVGNYLGNNEVGYQVWGFQVEESPIANGYVKTLSTSVSGYSTVGIDQSRQEKEGWLIEGSSTNYALYSQDFTDSAWEKSGGVSVISNFGTSPDGSQTSSQVTFTGEAQSIYQIVPTLNDVECSLSVWVKGNVGETIQFSGVDPLIFALTGEWQRIVTQGTATPLSLNFNTYKGATARVLEFWGAQAEALPFATSYIPTTDSAVTRAADIEAVPYSENAPRGDQPFTFYFKGKIDGYTSFNRLFGADTSSLDARIYVFMDDSGDILLTNGADQNVARTIPAVFGDTFEYVITSDGVTYTSYLNGIEQSTAPVASPATELPNELRVLRGNSIAGDSYGNCEEFRVYDFALNEAEAKFLAGE